MYIYIYIFPLKTNIYIYIYTCVYVCIYRYEYVYAHMLVVGGWGVGLQGPRAQHCGVQIERLKTDRTNNTTSSMFNMTNTRTIGSVKQTIFS